MKKRVELLFCAILSFILVFTSFSLAATTADVNCDLKVSLVNQDPYPAVPGDLLKLVFQVDGIDSTNCGDLELSLSESFPFVFDPSSEKVYNIKSGTYNTQDFKTYFQAPFKVRVNEKALDGENIIEFKYKSSTQPSGTYLTKQFKIEVKDLKADFEIFVKNYDSTTNIVTFQVLNIGKEDISAVTVEIPKQENVVIKGANKNIIGDLNSNEDTTADFEMTSNTSKLNLVVYYTDSSGERRSTENVVSFDSDYFIGRKAQQQTTSIWTYLVYLIILLVVVYFGYKKFSKKKKSKLTE